MLKILSCPKLGASVFYFCAAIAVAPASAAPIIDLDSGLSIDPDNIVFFGQTTASPCVIGGDNCQNPVGFEYTDAPSGGGGVIHDFLSPVPRYTVAQIEAIAGGPAFNVAIDYNESNIGQTLYFFEANYYNAGGLLSSQIFDITTFLPTNNNGVGFSDFILSGFVIPVGATEVQFHANWFNNDGPDRYFILGEGAQPCSTDCPPVNVPEPASFALFGLVATVAAAVRRRRK